MPDPHDLRPVAQRAAVLFCLGLATGVLVSAAMTGKIPADPHAMLASHLNEEAVDIDVIDMPDDNSRCGCRQPPEATDKRSNGFSSAMLASGAPLNAPLNSCINSSVSIEDLQA